MDLIGWLSLIATVIAIIGGAVGFATWWQVRGPRLLIVERKNSPKRAAKGNRHVLSMLDVQVGMRALVKDISRSPAPNYIVGINRGGAIVGGWLAKKFDLARVVLLDVDPERPEPDRVIEHNHGDPISGQVLLVDDARRSSTHMNAAATYLKQKYPQAKVRRAVLLELRSFDPHEDRRGSAPVEHRGYFTHDGQLKFPWDKLPWD